MRMSDTISKLATALAKAQGAMDDATKDASNPHFRSKYADLAAVRAVIREPLAVNGLSYVQSPSFKGNAVEVETMLMHESGEFLGTMLTIPVTKPDAHGIGSATSYGRRYGLMALLGIAADDDDGNGATGRPTQDRDGPAHEPAPRREAPAREPVPTEPPLSAPESKSVCESMLLALDMCETREHLHAWATSNSAAKQRLTSADQAILKGRFELKQKDIKNARAPMSEAAE